MERIEQNLRRKVRREKPHVPRRGRPSAERADTIDRLIIRVAREMFFDLGFDATSMEQVAARAQVSKGTLYARHPSKENLFKSMLEATIADWSLTGAEGDHLLGDDIDDRLRYHALTIATALQQPDVKAIQRLMPSMTDRFPDLVASFYESGFRYIADLIASDLDRWAKQQGRNLRDSGGVARVLVTSLAGMEMQTHGSAMPKGKLEAFAERLVDLLVAAKDSW